MYDASTDVTQTGDSQQAVILFARRLPTARAGGAYRNLRAHELAAAAIAGVVSAAGLDPREIDDVVLGNATGGGGNVARLASLSAGLPQSVPGLTVDRQCGSGLEAIIVAARMVESGAGELYLAGGVESISTAPARAYRGAGGELEFFDRAQFAPHAIGDPDAGQGAENVAAHYGISRERQDAYALTSHARAVSAGAAGRFAGELLPFSGLDADQGPRGSLDAAIMARFPAVFVPGGTVTAGNSCPYSDGAAVAVVTTRARAEALAGAQGGVPALLFEDSAVAGNDPNLLGVGAAHATLRLLERAASRGDGFDRDRLRTALIEFNEAFAAQVLASADMLGLDPMTFNPDGGALALGHPYGASGAILITRLLARAGLRATPGVTAVAMISIAGGMGLSARFTTLHLPGMA